uniref:CipC-like antibiotic response protein n=1 Tax=Araucaria cunninghamii TaxID=56994 RepID=A0A0D6R837_ARACU
MWDESRDAHRRVYGEGEERHEGKFSHELLGGAAAFEGMKLYEDKQRREGKVVNHAFAKELLMGFVGGEVDKLAETKGMDEYDKIEAKRHAERHAEQMYDDHYVRGQNADEYDPNRYDAPNFNY